MTSALNSVIDHRLRLGHCRDCGEHHVSYAAALLCDHRLGRHKGRTIDPLSQTVACPGCRDVVENGLVE